MRKSVFTEHHGAKTGVFPPGALWGLGAQSETREQAWGTRRPWSAWLPQLTGAHPHRSLPGHSPRAWAVLFQ